MQTKKEKCSLFLFFYMCKCTHSGYRWSKDHQWKTQEGILLCRYSILLKEDTFWTHSIDNTLKIFLRRIVFSTKCLGIGCRQAQVCSLLDSGPPSARQMKTAPVQHSFSLVTPGQVGVACPPAQRVNTKERKPGISNDESKALINVKWGCIF